MSGGEMKVKVRLAVVAAILRGSGRRYVSVREVGELLGVTSRTAGRILARLEREGVVSRYSRRTYRVLHPKGSGGLGQGPGEDGGPEDSHKEVSPPVAQAVDVHAARNGSQRD
ncbi:helix-turn-helix domain-containing protein [Aeropyrum pernix]|uniref:helix-turn-helix domain-containing protein n=1 Tax=Aeropyrum pernix TaxID=56636 RepID=UPI001037508B|nr:helix-turn-helix domain-containing protein [Aeropyrum pernix]